MTLTPLASSGQVQYPGMLHIGFIQTSRAEVDILNAKPIKGGFKVKPAREFHGSYTFYVITPGNFTVEGTA